jgi:signal transduction histidine kinase
LICLLIPFSVEVWVPKPVDNQHQRGFRRAHALFSRADLTTWAIWPLLAAIFVYDLQITTEQVSVSFAYAIPVLLSLFERKPRPFLYASVAFVLSILGTFIQPPNDVSMLVLAANRAIAILMQWVVAALVALQHRRLLDAQEKAETQRRFVDILSHEVGTALTTVTGQAFMLAKLSGPVAPEELRPRADKLRAAVERIQAIISRIQIASSYGDGSIPAGTDPIDVQTIICQLTDQMREERRAGPIELQLAQESPLVIGDETMLRHVFENVILNSIKYSPPGSPIRIAVAHRGGTVQVSVSDQGSGIATEELPRIRSAYYRGQNSKGISGAGLGLYVVERLVEAHNGRMSIESKVGAGTTLRIELPKMAAVVR